MSKPLVEPILLASEKPESARDLEARSGEPRGVSDPFCVGCGGYHGSVGFELRCLRAEVSRLRLIQQLA